MVSHANLAAEINIVNGMSAEERLAHARQRRVEQIKRWEDYESEYTEKHDDFINGESKKAGRNVTFGASITLLEAAARDDIEEVERFLRDGVNPNEANDDGLTALHQACIDNFEDMVKLLIKFGANVNAVDSEQWTPLHAACTCGHTTVAKILIQSGADLLALNADHNMPYDICEDEDTLEYVEKSMAARGITQEQINETRSAKERQIIFDMQNLIKQGQGLDEKDSVGATVLHMAAAHGYADLSKFLLSNYSNANCKDNDGWTPLHAAAYWNQLEIVELLGQENGDPTIKNSLGETPADVTDDEEIKQVLLKIKTAMKDRKSRKLFPSFRGFSSRNNSRRASGIRGQSFKGRSKRDKKAGISTIEAKSEAQFWSGGQETSDIMKADTPTENNNHIEATATTEVTAVPTDSAADTNLNNDSSASVYTETDANPTKKDKKNKKSKNQVANNEENSGHGNANGTYSAAGIRAVISSRHCYNLDIDDSADSKIADSSNSGSGKTLTELKRERAQEKSNKASHDNDSSPSLRNYAYSDDLKQFKGQTNNDLLVKHHKRKFCVIL